MVVKIIDSKEDKLNFTVRHLIKLKILNVLLLIIYENICRFHVYCDLCNICLFMKYRSIKLSGQSILENPYYYDPSSHQYSFGNCDQ